MKLIMHLDANATACRFALVESTANASRRKNLAAASLAQFGNLYTWFLYSRYAKYVYRSYTSMEVGFIPKERT